MVAQVKNEDFFNLPVGVIVQILKEDITAITSFLAIYNFEKQNYIERNSMTSNDTLNMSWSEQVLDVINELPENLIIASDENISSTDFNDENIIIDNQCVIDSQEVDSVQRNIPGHHKETFLFP